MTFEELEVVVLKRDLPTYKLRVGDLGVVVEVYPLDGLEVEFVTAGGKTHALVTLTVSDVRKVSTDDVVAVRSPQAAA